MSDDPRAKPPKTLTVAEQYSVLREVWGAKQLVPGEPSYVGLGMMDPEKPIVGANGHRKFNDQKTFVWPDDTPAIQAYLKEHKTRELYFTANQFAERGRAKESARPERALWADLDEADPREGMLRQWAPTIAWETSPGSFQAVWVLEEHGQEKSILSDSGGLNQQLNYAVGADRGGWASNKYLRVPGSLNCKPERMASNGGNPHRGKLLWRRYRTWMVKEFKGLPELSTKDVADITHASEEMIDAVNRVEVWQRVRMRVSKRIREFMALRTLEQVDDAASGQVEGKSGVLWEIERELADAGCNAVEIVAIVRRTHWNKFTGRSNEITQLLREASKAVSEKPEATDDVLEVSDDGADMPSTSAVWISDLEVKPRKRTAWLIQDIWPEGACGFISGVPKSYKSFLAVDLAVALTTGAAFLGEFRVAKKVPVLLIEEEDNEALLMDRYDRIVYSKAPQFSAKGYLTLEGSDTLYHNPPKGRPKLAAQVHSGFTSSEPKWHDWLEATIEENGFKVVLIDTLGTTLGMVDSYKSEDMNRKVLRPLKAISVKHDCAIIIIHHVRKANAGANGQADARHGQDMMGSTANHAWVEAALYVYDKKDVVGRPSQVFVARETKADTELRFSVKIPHMGDGEDESPLWQPEVNRNLMDNVGIEQKAQSEVAHRSKAGFVIANKIKEFGAVNGRTILLPDIMERIGGSRQTVTAQLTKAVANGFLDGNPGSGYTFIGSN